MKTFAVIHKEQGEMERESVSDCADVDAYINRKFGCEPERLEKHGLSVIEMTEEAGAPADPVESAEPALVPEPTIVPAVDMHDASPSSSDPA